MEIKVLLINLKSLAFATSVSMLVGVTPVFAVELSQDILLNELRRLSERLEKLEIRNAELESKTQGAPSKSEIGLVQRIKALEENNNRMAATLDRDLRGRENPEIINRLKDIEIRTLSIQKQARMIESLEGVTAGASLTMVAQSANRKAVATDAESSALNYRGDISVTLPGGSVNEAEGRIFAHFRLGQGKGVALNNTLTSTPNTTAFQLASRDDSTALLAQAWYQMDVPLFRGGNKLDSREHLEINFGKIDPFLFFDQNTVADDESSRFLNNVFVHNPLLDSGGDVGVDSYGFTPGMRIAYHNETSKPEWWRVSLGVFGAGKGAGFEHGFSTPFIIGQLESGLELSGGLNGNYRLYAWRNGQSTAYQNGLDTSVERHSGWGVSIDQCIGDATTLFGRYGKTINGKVRFDQALTLGAEIKGTFWNRNSDSLGMALGWLRTGNGFRENSAMLDADIDGNPDFGYRASGYEQLAEVYYRMGISKALELTPDFQLIRQPGGDRNALSARVIGLRAKVSF